jgi:hypothetical protein
MYTPKWHVRLRVKHYLILALLFTALALIVAGVVWFSVWAWGGAIQEILKNYF